MAQGLWRRWFIVATILLVISVIVCIGLWHQLSDIKIKLDNTIAQLSTSKPEMDSIRAERDQMLNDYANLKRQIDLRLGIGLKCKCFVTPDAPEISATVQQITGDYSEQELWEDYGRLFRWIILNVEYNADSPTPILPEHAGGTLKWQQDFWRMPAETIRDRAGDCEDMSVLLASMLLNYNQRRFPIWVVRAQTSIPPARAHMAVAIPSKNDQLSIFDTAGCYYTPFQTIGGFGSQEVSLAVSHWLSHLDQEVPGAEICVVFSDDFYKEFSSTREFVDWLKKF